MDPSNKLSFLRGDLKLRADKIDPKTWSKLVFDFIYMCKPHLSHLPKQHAIKELLNCMLSDYDKRITPKEKVVFPRGVSFETKCIEVVQLESSCVQQVSKLGFGQYDSASETNLESITEKRLLLTYQGKLLKWVAEYRPRKVSGLGFRSHHTGTYYTAESASFGTVTVGGLASLLVGNDKLAGHTILSTLHELVQEGVDNRKRFLAQMVVLNNQMSETMRRIE